MRKREQMLELLGNLGENTIMEKKSWIKEKQEMLTVISVVVGCFSWMTINMGYLRDDIRDVRTEIGDIRSDIGAIRNDIHDIDRRLTKVETVIYIKGIISHEIAARDEA